MVSIWVLKMSLRRHYSYHRIYCGFKTKFAFIMLHNTSHMLYERSLNLAVVKLGSIVAVPVFKDRW